MSRHFVASFFTSTPRFAVIAALIALSGAAASAQTLSEAAPEGSVAVEAGARYNACLDVAQNDPAKALEIASQWGAIGGGGLARHCGAIAKIALGAEASAAVDLTEIGSSATDLAPQDRMAALVLAGELWLRLQRPGLAKETFTAALGISDISRAAKLGLGHAHAMLGEWAEAEASLSRAIALDSNDAEALTLRAAARRAQKNHEGAYADAKLATEIAPEAAMAWFERGAAERELERRDEARASWLKASILDESGAAGDLARANLQREASTE